MQQALDVEQKAKTEQSRQKKKAEADFAELESQIDTANRVNGEQAKTVKKLQQQIKELQSMLDDEQRAREDGRDVTARSERRCNDLAQELDELKMAFEQVGNGFIWPMEGSKECTKLGDLYHGGGVVSLIWSSTMKVFCLRCQLLF